MEERAAALSRRRCRGIARGVLVRFRKSRLYRSVAGQMLAIFALTWIIFAGGLFSVYNVGTLVGERMRVQTAVDCAAYTGAVWEARCLNYIAYTNRCIISELSFMGWLCALTSCVKAWQDICQAASAIPYVGPIFSAIANVLDVIENILETIVDLPWKLLPQGMGLLQTAMEAFLQVELPLAMQEVGAANDPNGAIDINQASAALAVNVSNHLAIRKEGDWQGLKKVLEDTIGPYTTGDFDGSLPIYNRDFQISFPIINLIAFKVELRFGVYGDCDINKSRIKTSDGPGGGVYMGIWDPCDGWDWTTLVEFDLGIWSEEIEIDLDSIRYYVLDEDDNTSVGIYATARKNKNDISDLVFQKLNGMIGADEEHLNAIAKARAVYADPEPGSSRQTTLAGDGLEPNLFNPFWRAELVSVTAKDEEDKSPGTSNATLIYPFMGSGLAYKRH